MSWGAFLGGLIGASIPAVLAYIGLRRARQSNDAEAFGPALLLPAGTTTRAGSSRPACRPTRAGCSATTGTESSTDRHRDRLARSLSKNGE